MRLYNINLWVAGIIFATFIIPSIYLLILYFKKPSQSNEIPAQEEIMIDEMVEYYDDVTELEEYPEEGIRLSIQSNTTDKYLLALHFMRQSYITD